MCAASGGFHRLLNEAAEASDNLLLRTLSRVASDVAKIRAVIKFNVGKSVVTTNGLLRAKEFKSLPNLLFKIGNADDALALVAPAECIIAFEAMPIAVRLKLHPRAVEMLTVGWTFRQDALECLETSAVTDIWATAKVAF